VSPTVLIDPGTRFTCVPCGFCCSFWDIHIDRQRVQVLKEIDWAQKKAEDLRRQGQELFRVLDQDGPFAIQRRQGACGFLDDRLLCAIHAKENFEAKPLICQQYPNIYFETPRGLEVSLDFSCPEVIRNAGELLTPERTTPRGYVTKAAEEYPLNSGTTLDWDGYLRLEEAFLRILAGSNTFEEKILGMDQLASDLADSLRGAGLAKGEAVKAALQSIGDVNERVTKVRAAANTAKRGLYVAILVHWVESTFAFEVTGKAPRAGRVIASVFKQWKAIGSGEFAVLKLKVDYGRVGLVKLSLESTACRDPLDRYLRYLTKSLVGTGTMVIQKRLAIIATDFALVKWLSQAHASANSRPEVALDDLVFGIKVVEKFLSNRLFNKLEQQKGFLSNYIGLLFDNPGLPATMLA